MTLNFQITVIIAYHMLQHLKYADKYFARNSFMIIIRIKLSNCSETVILEKHPHFILT